MSFEDRLRERLHDLADHEDGWDDPAPAARARATQVAGDDAVTPTTTSRPGWRHRLPTLAVAAVLVAVVLGGGTGLVVWLRSGGSGGGSSGASLSYGTDVGGNGAKTGEDATAGAPSVAPGGAAAGGSAGCAATLPTASTGPLAGIAGIRPAGITGATVGTGGSTQIPYVLSFTADGPDMQARAAQVYLRGPDGLVPLQGGASSFAIQVVPVHAGATTSGSATLHAVDCSGAPLAAGHHEVVVVIQYAVAGGGTQSVLVSAPVGVDVR